MSLETLTWADYTKAATGIRTDPPSVKAVAMVESPRGAFMFYKGERRPTILFEPHKFYVYSGPKPYSRTHPHLSRRRPLAAGQYGSYDDQWDKYEEAKALGEEKAAMLSCSWGAFQIMGFNYAKCGFSSVERFVEAMWMSEQLQLEAFMSFIGSDPKLAAALRSKNWSRFAILYNGPAHRDYDKRMHDQYTSALTEWENMNKSPDKAVALTGEELKFVSDRLATIDKAVREIKERIGL